MAEWHSSRSSCGLIVLPFVIVRFLDGERFRSFVEVKEELKFRDDNSIWPPFVIGSVFI